MSFELNKEFPTLFAKAKTGKIKEWTIRVEYDLDTKVAHMISRHGFVDGKKQESCVVISKGKNLGKKNATTPLQQALKEASSKWTKRHDDGYKPDYEEVMLMQTNTDSEGRVKPMLAKKFDEKKVVFPCYSQPKYDGVRALAHKVSKDKVEIISRKGKVYDTLEHIEKDLLKVMPVGMILDGEIYGHDMPFQTLTGAVKKKKEETLQLHFRAYDVVNDKPFKERLNDLTYLQDPFRKTVNVKFAPTPLVMSRKGIDDLNEKWLEEGYEGTMIRNKEGMYEKGFRSKDLMKYKAFDDAEFEIVGGKEGVGKFAGCCTFEVKTADGKTFSACPKGTLEQKKEYWTNLDDYIGKMLTVEFFGVSEDGIPRFPIGVAIRDYE